MQPLVRGWVHNGRYRQRAIAVRTPLERTRLLASAMLSTQCMHLPARVQSALKPLCTHGRGGAIWERDGHYATPRRMGGARVALNRSYAANMTSPARRPPRHVHFDTLHKRNHGASLHLGTSHLASADPAASLRAMLKMRPAGGGALPKARFAEPPIHVRQPDGPSGECGRRAPLERYVYAEESGRGTPKTPHACAACAQAARRSTVATIARVGARAMLQMRPQAPSCAASLANAQDTVEKDCAPMLRIDLLACGRSEEGKSAAGGRSALRLAHPTTSCRSLQACARDGPPLSPSRPSLATQRGRECGHPLGSLTRQTRCAHKTSCNRVQRQTPPVRPLMPIQCIPSPSHSPLVPAQSSPITSESHRRTSVAQHRISCDLKVAAAPFLRTQPLKSSCPPPARPPCQFEQEHPCAILPWLCPLTCLC